MSDTRLTVAVSNDFFKAFNKLPEKSRGKVATFISKFRDNPTSPGLNYERIEGGKDGFIRSVRVDQEIRCIVRAPETGNAYVLLWVDKHDDAYQWARRRTCHVNRVSGALQVVDVESAEEAVATSTVASQEIQAPSPSHEPKSLFEACDDDQLMLLGVPEALLPAVRACSSEEALSRLIEWVPQSCVDGLILLADGRSIDEVIDELGRTISNIAKVVPEGLVIFFPSFGYKSKVRSRWESTKMMQNIQQRKSVLWESRDKHPSEILSKYSQLVKESKNGAILMCVVGGKLSEGINFKDGLARGVAVVGMPYPNSQDPLIVEKISWINRKFGVDAQNDSKSKTKKKSSMDTPGQQYYENLCMRTGRHVPSEIQALFPDDVF